jgi:hypothetical protein
MASQIGSGYPRKTMKLDVSTIHAKKPLSRRVLGKVYGFYQPPRIGEGTNTAQSVPDKESVFADKSAVPASTATNAMAVGTRFLILTYTIALIFPILLQFGSITFSATRLFFTVVTIPVMVRFFVTKKLVAPDVCVLLYVIWASICLAFNHGLTGGLEPAGSHFFEVAGAYFLARITMNETEANIFWAKCLLFAVIFLLPFSIFETITGRPIVLEVIGRFFRTYATVTMAERLGFERVQAVFEHPILYGVFCASAFSSSVLIVARNSGAIKRIFFGLIVAIATFLSLATGAYINVIWQFIMIGWNFILKSRKHRWRTLVVLAFLGFITVDLLSNRTPFEVFVTYFTFDTNSAYNRINIWNFGTAEVLRNPIFGIGFKDWVRAPWMSSSFDNFWLLRAMRYGLPGIILLSLAVILTARGVTYRIDLQDKDLSAVSTAQLCGLIGSSISLVTVDVWSGSHTFFYFSVGAAVALNQSFTSQQHR